MSVTIKDVDALVEALRIASGQWQGDLGSGGACRIEREIRDVIMQHRDSENAPPSASVNRLVGPWECVDSDVLLRGFKTPNSIRVAEQWFIGRSDDDSDWQVFWCGGDANFRREVAEKREKPQCRFHATFRDAWNWIRELGVRDIEMICQ